MTSIGRSLIVIGIVSIVLGILLSRSDILSTIRLGRLPGDIFIRRDSFRFYFPITTCVIISLLLTIIYYIFRK